MTILSLLVILFPLTVGFHDKPTGALATWACQPEQWVGTPVLQDGLFMAEMAADCRITASIGSDLSLLERRLTEEAIHVETVHSGPTPGSFQGLDGVRFDVTVKDSISDMRLRKDLFIVSNRVDRLIYASISKEISGSGSAALVKKLDVVLDITAQTTPGAFDVRMTDSLHLKRPWYAPNAKFKTEAMKAGREQFLKYMSAVMPALAAYH